MSQSSDKAVLLQVSWRMFIVMHKSPRMTCADWQGALDESKWRKKRSWCKKETTKRKCYQNKREEKHKKEISTSPLLKEPNFEKEKSKQLGTYSAPY